MPAHRGLSHLSQRLRDVHEITVTSTAATLNALWLAASGADLRGDMKHVVLHSASLGDVHYTMDGDAAAASPAFLAGLGEKGIALDRDGADELSLYAAADTDVIVEVYA